MAATFATIASRMRFNLFSRNEDPQPEPVAPQGAPRPMAPAPPTAPMTGRTFPADEVVWGIAIRNGFDEIDDPWHHRGTTQHAYLEGNDNVAICGFRPPQSGPRTRRRSRLGMPTAGEHPMCGMCARMVVAPRPRAPIPVQSGRPPVALPVSPGAGVPFPISTATAMTVPPVPAPVNGSAPAAAPAPVMVASPWVRQRSGLEEEPETISVDLAAKHDSGLFDRGVRADFKDE